MIQIIYINVQIIIVAQLIILNLLKKKKDVLMIVKMIIYINMNITKEFVLPIQ